MNDRRSGVRGQGSEVGGQRSFEECELILQKISRCIKGLIHLRWRYSILARLWPHEEKYSLTDQIRRSSRSVCANLREAWAKRRYEAHFTNKLTEWLDFAKDCGYLSEVDHRRMTNECREVGAMLGSMLNNPALFFHQRVLNFSDICILNP